MHDVNLGVVDSGLDMLQCFWGVHSATSMAMLAKMGSRAMKNLNGDSYREGVFVPYHYIMLYPSTKEHLILAKITMGESHRKWFISLGRRNHFVCSRGLCSSGSKASREKEKRWVSWSSRTDKGWCLPYEVNSINSMIRSCLDSVNLMEHLCGDFLAVHYLPKEPPILPQEDRLVSTQLLLQAASTPRGHICGTKWFDWRNRMLRGLLLDA